MDFAKITSVSFCACHPMCRVSIPMPIFLPDMVLMNTFNLLDELRKSFIHLNSYSEVIIFTVDASKILLIYAIDSHNMISAYSPDKPVKAVYRENFRFCAIIVN